MVPDLLTETVQQNLRALVSLKAILRVPKQFVQGRTLTLKQPNKYTIRAIKTRPEIQ